MCIKLVKYWDKYSSLCRCYIRLWTKATVVIMFVSWTRGNRLLLGKDKCAVNCLFFLHWPNNVINVKVDSSILQSQICRSVVPSFWRKGWCRVCSVDRVIISRENPMHVRGGWEMSRCPPQISLNVLWLNPGLYDDKLLTNRLKYVTARYCLCQWSPRCWSCSPIGALQLRVPNIFNRDTRWRYCNTSYKCLQTSCSYLQIVSARRMTWSILHTEWPWTSPLSGCLCLVHVNLWCRFVVSRE